MKISDGAGDGKVDAFTEKSVGGSTRSILVNSKFTETFDQIAPPKFYDEIVRFRRAFEDSEARQEYLDTVKASFRDSFDVFFDRYDNGLADLIFITNHRVNPKQIDTIKNVGVTVLHLDDLLQYMADNIEGAMPRTNSLVLTDITQVLSPPRADTGIATSLVFAKLTDFIEYMKSDPHELLFSRNIRLNLMGTEVNDEIATTFAQHPEEFAYSNNGITMLCEKHVHETGSARLYIENPRVVNGSQTLHSVRRAKKKPESARVMVKIIEIPPPRSTHFEQDLSSRKEIVSKIALRTNRQNIIKKSDLRANDECQHDIAAFFRRHNLYYERRKKEWDIRRIDLQSVGITKGPTLKELIQLGAAYLWETVGPAKARSSVNLLFTDDVYENIVLIPPQGLYRLYLIQDNLLGAAKRVAFRTSARNKEMRRYVNFAMFSLFIKSLQQIRFDIVGAVEAQFLDIDRDKDWEVIAKLLFDLIGSDLRARVKAERSNGALTIINYSKNSTYMAELVKSKLPATLIKATKSLVRA